MKLLQDILIAASESSRSEMHSYKNRHIAFIQMLSILKVSDAFSILPYFIVGWKLPQNKAAKRSGETKQRTNERERLNIQRRKLEQFHFRSWLIRLFVLFPPSSSCTSYLFFSKFFPNISFCSSHSSIYFIGSTWRFCHKVESLQ